MLRDFWEWAVDLTLIGIGGFVFFIGVWLAWGLVGFLAKMAGS